MEGHQGDFRTALAIAFRIGFKNR